MNDRIETLEDLNEWLSPDYTFSIGWKHAKNTPEKFAWHLLEDLPFDLDIILKGTRDWNDGIEREAMDTVEKLDERYGNAFTFDNKELSDWLFSTPLENLAAYTARVIRRQEVNKVSHYYDAAQDHYADYWHEWDEYEDQKITAREFIRVSHGDRCLGVDTNNRFTQVPVPTTIVSTAYMPHDTWYQKTSPIAWCFFFFTHFVLFFLQK